MQRLSDEMVSKFETWADDDGDVLEELWPYVNPSMSGRERARKAVLLTVASHTDKNGMRGRLHTLMHGPPGTGKTHLRDWARNQIEGAYGVGPKSSEAGLKGDASGKELTPGALAMAHGSVLCIEELDKFKKSERDALYEAMSDGKFEVTQGEIREVVPAEVRTVATCNHVEKFADAMVDRFDFVIEMPEYDAEETVDVADTLYGNFEQAFIKGEPVTDDRIIPQYLAWVETYEPGAEDGCMDTIRKMRDFLIKREGFAGSIRKKEAWLRCAYTIAKLNRRDMRPDDFVTAITLMHPEKDVEKYLIAIRDDDMDSLLS